MPRKKLKCCPWCNCVPHLYDTGEFVFKKATKKYRVGCWDVCCDVQPFTRTFKTKQAAINAWNKRKGKE